MDNISEKLADLLNDPDSLNRVREMAESLLGDNSKSCDDKTPKSPDSNIGALFGEDFNPEQLGKIISVMSRLKKDCDDNRAKLLLALKPHLSAPRREKVDTAVKLLKLFDLLPLLKESGMFEF